MFVQLLLLRKELHEVIRGVDLRHNLDLGATLYVVRALLTLLLHLLKNLFKLGDVVDIRSLVVLLVLA